MNVSYVPCASEAEVSEHAARWRVRPRWNPDELQHEAVRKNGDGHAVEVAWYSPLDEAPGSGQ